MEASEDTFYEIDQKMADAPAILRFQFKLWETIIKSEEKSELYIMLHLHKTLDIYGKNPISSD